MSHKYDLLTVGNAIIDILVTVEEEFLVEQKLDKSAMKLVDADESKALYSKVGEATERSGGSAANTAVGYGYFGGKASYIGTIAKDQFGTIFNHDMDASGVDYTPIYVEGKPTSQSIILVTPDGERTMNTYLGASTDLGPEHIDKELILSAKTVYFEGYLWYQPPAKAAFDHIAKLTKGTDTKISVSLADQFCVDNFRDSFKGLIDDGTIEILFANEDEIKALYQVDTFEEAMAENAKTGVLSFITRGANGAVAQQGDVTEYASVDPVFDIVDLTGAGDIFAAGALYGLEHGMSLADSTQLGCVAAREVIQHMGPHPKVDIISVAKKAGLL
ncbi:MAG: adenosine kinase [Hyphomicrobiales bacterium]|nr:MAG: adenosine kinase [Hyphomicrobiales bacterium]